ncbi:MAG: sodium/proton-translocating pyrophosphatase, partial [Coriobacteriales bacterium]|nr:sodium/proton-translocating pyrophosphatase [Coriobacteriales bacterium]
MSPQLLAWLAPICAVVGLAFAFGLARWVLAQDSGNEKMAHISGLIQKGATAFLFSEYKRLIIFVVVVAII